MKKRITRAGHARTAIALAIALLIAPAMAQNTSSAIAGRVTGGGGRPVIGADVSVIHNESGSVSKLVTDGEGRYGARGLRVGGPYTITITKDGKVERRENVYLPLAETLNLDASLGAEALQKIVVSGTSNTKIFNSAAMGTGTSLGRAELDAFASIQRNLQDYARIDPRLSQTDKERGELSAAGQNTRYNSITIDGVTTSDTFGLEANNLPTAKQPISIDAIESVQVNVANYDVTQKGYTGANINAVTKSGTNEIKGSVYYVFRDEGGIGDRYNRANGSYFPFRPFKEDTKGATLGGPIVKDKLFFFGSYEELKSNRAQPEFGPVGSALTNVAISQNQIDAIRTLAKNQYKIDIGDAIGPSELLVKDMLLKLDWNISDKHRANVRFARTEQNETNFGNFGATSLSLTSWWWDQQKSIDTVVGQWFADWTPNFSTELKVSNRDYNSVPQNNSNLPAMALQFSGPAPAGAPAGVNTGSRYLNFGTELSRHYNVLDTKTLDVYFGANWAVDNHELKFGADLQDNKVYNAFFQNTKGNYTFSCQNSSATYTYSFGAINCGTATAAQIEAAILENVVKGRPSSYQVQVPVAGGTLDDGIAKWSLADAGVFVQDTWAVNDQLTITGGVRLDTLSTGDKPVRNAAAAAPTVAGSVTGNTVVRNSGGFGLDNSITVDGQNLLQPRLGFNYRLNPKEDKKGQVRGGFGLFQGAAANVWLSNPYSNTGLATRVIGCGTLGFPACPAAGGIFSVAPASQPTNFPGTSPAANVDFIDKDLTQPAVWKMNLAYDTELPWGGLVFGAEYLHTKTDTGIYYQHLNLGGATRTGPDGRELFYTPQAYNPACWTATGGTITSGACAGLRSRALGNAAFNNVLVAVPTDQGVGNVITLSLSGPNKRGLGWQVAYTRTSATEVSPLTSSVANSNFNSRSVFNPNEEVAANSAYLVKDRVSASINWSRAFVDNHKTTLGLFYEGRSGKPYSWTYRNDINGDGVSGNDLMYIPSGPQSGEVIFLGDSAANHAKEDLFWSIVNQNSALSGAKGGVVKRNSEFSPWVNSVDMRISQEIPGFRPKHKGLLVLDILNVGNLLNKNWGRTNEMAFGSSGGQTRKFVNYVGIDPNGKYIYQVSPTVDDLTLRQVKGESQWAMQVSLKYEF
ncbi:MAG: TonB-dependent receptor [Sterolibacterium sp.]|jgi:hypothetical protein